MVSESACLLSIFEFTWNKSQYWHAAFVCLCGRAIEDNLIRILDNERILSYEIWERYKVRSLMDTIVMYPTFRNMVQSLRADFGHKVKSTDAEYLADEGVLVRGEVVGSFKLSSPLDVIFQARYHPFKLLNYQSIVLLVGIA
uniref:Uncharacterized protein n=1 Tax=Rhizophagus irregularis (strain DAOM 181602 / DAOM 197198 / MUCL 43194) TaxID=747089 RepID=U9UX66_RHIID